MLRHPEPLAHVSLLLAALLACKGGSKADGAPDDIAKGEFEEGERKAEAACRALDKAGALAPDPLFGHADCSAAKTFTGPKDTAFSYGQRLESFRAVGFVRVKFTPVGLFVVNGVPARGTVEYVSASSPFREPGKGIPADDYPAQEVASSKTRLRIDWSGVDDSPWDKCRAKASVKACAGRFPKEYAAARGFYEAARRVVDQDNP
jgi:hypothetical protein